MELLDRSGGGQPERNRLVYPPKVRSTYLRVKYLILQNLLQPGSRLQPQQLGTLLEVSATPVREALSLLASESLVISSANRGYFVKEFDCREQAELLAILRIFLHDAVTQPQELNRPLSHRKPLYDPLRPDFSSFRKMSTALMNSHPNDQMQILAQNILDRTHVIMTIALRDREASSALSARLSVLARAMEAADYPTAIAQLEQMFSEFTAQVPRLTEHAALEAIGNLGTIPRATVRGVDGNPQKEPS